MRKAEFVNGKMVYRDMTKKEEAELEKREKSAKSEPVVTEEDRISDLENRIAKLEAKMMER